MCGMVGYVGTRNASAIVLDGLKKLEYRGYDSAGIASPGGGVSLCRVQGKLANLEAKLKENPLPGPVAIGHIYGATHGTPVERNAHPHAGGGDRVVVVQNGIVENCIPLQEGHRLRSDTAPEVIAHLVEGYLEAGHDLVAACRLAFRQLQGAHAIAVVSGREPGKIVTAQLGHAGGVMVGLGEGENFLASDIAAILEYTRRIVFLEDQEMAVITAGGVEFSTLDGTPAAKQATIISRDAASAVKGGYRHFMQKEIYDQPLSLHRTIRGRVDFATGTVTLEELPLTRAEACAIERIAIVACGTSAYAGLIGQFFIERLAKIRVTVDYASEFRYRDPLLDGHTVVLAISQSGETADTLAALEEGRRKGARLWSIVNVPGSAIHRISDGSILMQAGPEISIASTKAFTATLTDLFLLGLCLGRLRGVLSDAESRVLAAALARLPELAGRMLAGGCNDYAALAERYHRREHFLFFGRGLNYPVALEGALKLKETSYIHAEGYPAGELKHGPIALVDSAMPVVCLVPRDSYYEKMISQVEQVRSRNGTVIALITGGDEDVAQKANHVLRIPPVHPLLTPVIAVIPLQLLAYHIAVCRDTGVDRPRNLVKSVTEE